MSSKMNYKKGFKKNGGIFHTFQNPPTPLANCGKKRNNMVLKSFLSKIKPFCKKIFFPIEKVQNTFKFQDLANLAAIWISEIF